MYILMYYVFTVVTRYNVVHGIYLVWILYVNFPAVLCTVHYVMSTQWNVPSAVRVQYVGSV